MLRWPRLIPSRYRQYNLRDMVVLRNKPPKWNDKLNAYCLNFGGRVTKASVKNFQLVSVDNMVSTISAVHSPVQQLVTVEVALPFA